MPVPAPPGPAAVNWSLVGGGIVAVLALQAYLRQGDGSGMAERMARLVTDDNLYMRNFLLVLGVIGLSAYAAYKKPELRPAAVLWWWA